MGAGASEGLQMISQGMSSLPDVLSKVQMAHEIHALTGGKTSSIEVAKLLLGHGADMPEGLKTFTWLMQQPAAVQDKYKSLMHPDTPFTIIPGMGQNGESTPSYVDPRHPELGAKPLPLPTGPSGKPVYSKEPPWTTKLEDLFSGLFSGSSSPTAGGPPAPPPELPSAYGTIGTARGDDGVLYKVNKATGEILGPANQ